MALHENEIEKDKLSSYLDTIERLEPDIHRIDPGAFYASAAISLKRIADFCDWVKAKIEAIEKEAAHAQRT